MVALLKKLTLLIILLAPLSLGSWFNLALAEDRSWSIQLKTKVMLDSHTSFEFGHPFIPQLSPLSRLEFPLDSFWAGLEARRQLGRLSLGVEFLSNMIPQRSGMMRDSDWEDPDDPSLLTILSHSRCRLNPSFQVGGDVDVQVADVLGLSSAFDVRPVVGFSWQQLSFTVSDVTQYTFDANGNVETVESVAGNCLLFDQDWYQAFMGLRLGYTFRNPPLIHPLKLYTQLDWRYVRGRNKDRHLLRAGNRITRENTSGDAWHAVFGALIELTPSTNLKLEFEYLRIETNGSHKLSADYYPTLTWTHGVRVWSEQRSVNLNLEYRF